MTSRHLLTVAALLTIGLMVWSCGHARPPPTAPSSPPSPSTVVLEPTPNTEALLLVAENQDQETLAFLYGVCGWLATTREIPQRYDPIYILTAAGNNVMTAGTELGRIAGLAREAGDGAKEEWNKVLSTQKGIDKLLPSRIDSYRCRAEATDRSRTTDQIPVVLGLSFANLGRAGVRYVTIRDKHPPRWGFFDLQGPKLTDDARHFAAEALFDAKDALLVHVVNRTRSADRCNSPDHKLCTYQSGETIISVEPARSPFFVADEVAIAPPAEWIIESVDHVPSVRRVRPRAVESGIGIQFLDSGEYTIGIRVHAIHTKGVERMFSVTIKVQEQDWLLGRAALQYEIACRAGGQADAFYTPNMLIGTFGELMGFSVLRLFGRTLEDTPCARPSSTHFSSYLQDRLSSLLVLDRAAVSEFMRELRDTVGGMHPEQMDNRAWRELSDELVSLTTGRPLIEIDPDFPLRIWMSTVSTSLSRDPEWNARSRARKAQKWCAALAADVTSRWPLETTALPPGTVWTARCALAVGAVVTRAVERAVPARKSGKGFIVDRPDHGWPLLVGHHEARSAFVPFDGEDSPSAALVEDASTQRRAQEMLLRLQLNDGTISTPLPVTVVSYGEPTVGRLQTVAALGIHDHSVRPYSETVFQYPILWELLHVGYGVAFQVGEPRYTAFVARLGLTSWCHWANSSRRAAYLCRPSVLILPYIEVGLRFAALHDGTDRFTVHKAFVAAGVSLGPFSNIPSIHNLVELKIFNVDSFGRRGRTGVVLDVGYHDGVSLGVGYMAAW